MLVSKEDILKYIKQIPPVPQNVKKCLQYLKEGELKKAAMEADKDLVLKKQIEAVVNSAYFSLPNKVEDTIQLFSLIGLEMAKNLVYSYLVSLLTPKEWKIFNINFYDFQASFMNEFENWMKEEFDEPTYKKYAEIGALVPSAVCVCDSLLGDKKEQVEIIMNSAPIDYGNLIKRISGMSLFEISAFIAKTWGLEEEKINVLKKCDCPKKCDNKVAALTHFLFFYLTSKPQFIDLNSLIEFNPSVIELIPKIYERIMNDS